MTLTDPGTGTRRSGSYDPATTTAGGLTAECARLEAQAELTFADEVPIIAAALAHGGGPLLEVGAGSGAVTRRLRTAFPGVQVVALDIDPGLLAREQSAPRLVADALALPLHDGTVGTVLLRYVLQHVADPVAVLAEVRRVLRPGGQVVVTDVDQATWGMAEPAYPELAAVQARVAAAQYRAGGDRTVARQLTRFLRRARYQEVGMRSFVTTNDTRPTEDFAAHLGPGRLAPLVASGDLSVSDIALVTDRWNRFRRDPDAWVMLLGFSAVGTAPGLPYGVGL